MPTLRALNADIENTQSIKLITQALGDIATLQIKATRKSVQQNIIYFQEITQLYRVVKGIALKHKLETAANQSKNGKTLLVLLTSNYHFYGGLDAELVSFYVQNLTKFPSADSIVIGSSGISLLEVMNELHNSKTLQFKKDEPSLEELSALSKLVSPYSKVLVFHSKFETLLNQKPTISDISEGNDNDANTDNKMNYILEPEISKMVGFFQGQIFILLFQAIFLDAQIARTSARMVAMNQAEDNADKMIKQERKELLHLRKGLINRRILETFAGMQNKN